MKAKQESNTIFSVAVSCIACDTCSSIAPLHFSLDDEGEQALVHAQPKLLAEFKKCEEAERSCPVGAIESQSI